MNRKRGSKLGLSAVVIALLATPLCADGQVADSARAGVTSAAIPSVARRAASEAWTGPDKLKHFFISAFIESFAFATARAAGADHSAALAVGLAATATAATAREIHDRRTKGIFSVPDLVWDAAGAAAAFLLLSGTQH